MTVGVGSIYNFGSGGRSVSGRSVSGQRGEGKVIMAERGLRGMIWICERCANEGKSDAVCMVKAERRPPGKGSAVWEDGKRMRCDRCEWKSVDELE